jgi:hypothetical protein
MHITILSQQEGGSIVNELMSILGVKWSIPIDDMGCGQWWDVD